MEFFAFVLKWGRLLLSGVLESAANSCQQGLADDQGVTRMADKQTKTTRILGVRTGARTPRTFTPVAPASEEAWRAVGQLHERMKQWSESSANTRHAMGRTR